MARPTKYNKAILEKANDYLDDYSHYGAVFPSHIGLSLYIGVCTDTLYDWEKQEDKKEFSDILRKIKAIQHEMVVSGGIKGDYNANIAKLLLGKHGYSDKQDTSLTGKDGKDLIPTAIQIIHE